MKPCADCLTMGQVIPWLALIAGELFLLTLGGWLYFWRVKRKYERDTGKR